MVFRPNTTSSNSANCRSAIGVDRVTGQQGLPHLFSVAFQFEKLFGESAHVERIS